MKSKTLWITGLSGSGKSTLANIIKESFNDIVLLDGDVLRNGICKDLNNKNYKYRILVVGSGKKWHRTKDDYELDEFERFKELGMEVVRKHIQEKKAKKIAHIDMSHLTYPQHWHLQFCMI